MNAFTTAAATLVLALLTACTTNPVLSGKPQDWVGHDAGEMRTSLGEPTKIVPQKDGSEVWIYSRTGEFVAPAEENTNFQIGGNAFTGAGGGINTVKGREHQAEFENVSRFLIKNGRVKQWWAQRLVDGRVVWEDH